MLHPVGELAPSVYWRRRILIIAALVLVVLSGYAVFHTGNGGSKTPVAGSGTTGGAARTSGSDSASNLPTGSSSTQASSPASKTSASRSAPVVPLACSAAQLSIAAATDAKSYAVGAKPNLALVVTNKGPAPCVADLADRQIELRVYSGSARVWGSHDCQIEPGSSPETLPVGQAIRRQIQWSGLSSQPGCSSVRQRVPAGTYSVFALLTGRQGSPATFTFTG
ncbi:MAG: hypothetical protein QOK10_1448 [Pseudonocardiales bacterium]|jgi:hypothetical protein|nr:hypothetical protein [Pseudonocardiales bacterium]